MKRRFQKRIFLLCLISAIYFGITAMSYGAAVVSIDPAEVSSPAPGEPLRVNIKIANGTNVAGYSLTVGFDATALAYVAMQNADYLPEGAFAAPAQVSGGRVTFAATSLSGVALARSGTLATLAFNVVAAKASTVELIEVILSDSAAHALPVSTRNGAVVVRQLLSTDLNKDGVVNVLDLTLVVGDVGKTGSPAGDVNGDGRVNVLDLVRVAQDLGKTIGGGLPSATGSLEGMVLIPAGEFRMGSNSGDPDERPVHSVYVDAFYMDKYEVTNAEYAAFLNAQGKHANAGQVWYDIGDVDARIGYVGGVYRVEAGYEDHPVVEVSWYGAMAYAAWVGKRLPTEAEWEKAARGGLSGQKYPWGNTINSSRANYNNHIGGTTVVGKYPANRYGLYDMAGNVWEWCLDEWNPDFYSFSPARNPVSGANSIKWLQDNYTGVRSSRVLRGGSWYFDTGLVRVANRNNYSPTAAFLYFGFRCARAVTP